jgi:glucose dehydrogenase
MYAPTVGKRIVAVDARTGADIWGVDIQQLFAPPVAYGPATRGLQYCRGDKAHGPRLFFTANGYLFALDSKTGRFIEGFAEHGRRGRPNCCEINRA